MVYISRSRSRSVSTAPITRATGLSLTCSSEVWAEAVLVRSVGVCEASWADAAESASARNPQMGSWYFIIPRLLASTLFPYSNKKGESRSSPLLAHHLEVYWKTVVMLLVLLASFDSPKWHWRQNCVVEGALVLATLLMFGL